MIEGVRIANSVMLISIASLDFILISQMYKVLIILHLLANSFSAIRLIFEVDRSVGWVEE